MEVSIKSFAFNIINPLASASGEVFKATYRGTEVAVKKMVAENVDKDVVLEFEMEVAIMWYVLVVFHADRSNCMRQWIETSEYYFIYGFLLRFTYQRDDDSHGVYGERFITRRFA